jgi:hypothetical protein
MNRQEIIGMVAERSPYLIPRIPAVLIGGNLGSFISHSVDCASYGFYHATQQDLTGDHLQRLSNHIVQVSPNLCMLLIGYYLHNPLSRWEEITHTVVESMFNAGAMYAHKAIDSPGSTDVDFQWTIEPDLLKELEDIFNDE